MSNPRNSLCLSDPFENNNLINANAADVDGLCVAKSSATMVLSV